MPTRCALFSEPNLPPHSQSLRSPIFPTCLLRMQTERNPQQRQPTNKHFHFNCIYYVVPQRAVIVDNHWGRFDPSLPWVRNTPKIAVLKLFGHSMTAIGGYEMKQIGGKIRGLVLYINVEGLQASTPQPTLTDWWAMRISSRKISNVMLLRNMKLDLAL